MSSLWLMLLLVAAAGAIGGAVNALLSDNGFALPKMEPAPGGTRILRPGYVGNVFIGAVAAVTSWGLYGPLGSALIIELRGAGLAAGLPGPGQVGLSLASLVGAILVGIGGARWLSAEVDKSLLRAAAAEAAAKTSSTEASQHIALASPAQALDLARKMAK